MKAYTSCPDCKHKVHTYRQCDRKDCWCETDLVVTRLWDVAAKEDLRNEFVPIHVPEMGIKCTIEEVLAMSRRQQMEQMPMVVDPDVEEKWMKLEQDEEEKARAMEMHHKRQRVGMRIEFSWMKQDEVQA